MLLGNMDAFDLDLDAEHDFNIDDPGNRREDDWGLDSLDDLEIDANFCPSDVGGFAAEGSREADLVPRLSRMDFDVMDYDDIDLPEMDSLLKDELVADGEPSGFADLLGARGPEVDSLSASSAGASFCSEIQLNLLRQPLPASVVGASTCSSRGCSDPGCAAPHCSQPMQGEQSVPSGGHMLFNPEILTPQPQGPRMEAPSAPAGPEPIFYATPASSDSENMTGSRVEHSSTPGSSSVAASTAAPSYTPEHSGNASASAPKRGRGSAPKPAPQAKPLHGPRAIAQKRLRSPDPRHPSPENHDGAGSPAYSSDEGPASSGDSTAAVAPQSPTVEVSKAETTCAPVGQQPNQAMAAEAATQRLGILHSKQGNGPAPSGVPPVSSASAGALGSSPAQGTPDRGDDKENKEDVKEDEAKRAQRMQRNRESALLSRQRRRMFLDELEKKNKELESENNQLKGCLVQLQAESHCLRTLLAQICHKHGEQMPQAMPLPMQMPAVPVTQGMALPFGFPAMMPYPIGVQVPAAAAGMKVPIQKLAVPARPAPAPKAAPPSKKAKTASAASARLPAKAAAPVLLLSLCGFFIIAQLGGHLNIKGGNPTDMQFMAQPAQPVSEAWEDYSLALPAADFDGGHGSGRVLMSIDPGPPVGNLTVGTAVSLVQAVWDTVSTREWGATSQPMYDECIQRNDPQVEALALQRLKELGRVAVISGWDKEPLQQPPAPAPAPWRSFSGMASSVLSAEGLLSPATCEEVFTIDADSLADPIAARRKLQAYLATMQTFRGRSIGAALPLPPIGGINDELQQEVANRSTGRNTTIGCPKEEGDLLVSILLPTKAPVVGEDAHLTSLDRIFVVVLKPSNKYSTYACGLQKPVLV